MKLNETEQKFCEYWLQRPSRIQTHLSRSQFTESTVEKLIYYEMQTRRRREVLNRLVGRFFRMRRGREWQRILNHLEVKGEGIRYRGLLSTESEEYWRQSI